MSSPGPLVVGIGASAGGLEALQILLRGLPAQPGFAIVVAFHLEPNARTALTDLLGRSSAMPVAEASDGVAIEADRVYTAPGHRLLALEDGVLRFVPAEGSHDRRTAIDHLLQSLATDQKRRAVAILLSGSGSDGSLGLKAVSDGGGMTIVQDPSTAKQDGMLRTAIETGVVDHVLPPDRIAEELLAYAEHVAVAGDGEARLREEVEAALPQVCEHLLHTSGHNFKHYKTSTLVRRVLRRMAVLRMPSARDYLARLRGEQAEADHLFRELLISVTAFFRDPDAFDALAREVLPHLLADRRAGDPVRVWVPGCATGEEAYTLAILLCEQMDQMENPPDVQVFATDIDERALAFARHGTFPIGITEELAPERLKRFFVKSGQTWQVSKQLREMVLFSAHNLINDPPFSRLDLISCRNLLIYLGTHLQKKLVPVFHYALRPGGYLFLGPSENLNSHRELFRPIDAKHRISQRLPTAIPPAEFLAGRSGPPTTVRPPNVVSTAETDTYLVMQRITLDEFAPKTVVVNDHWQIVCASGNLDKYMTIPVGEFHNSITRLVRDGLKVGLRTALIESAKIQRRVVHDGLMLHTEVGVQRVMVTVQPMPQLGEESGLFYIAFQDVGPIALPGEGVRLSPPDDVTFIEQLERELATTREDLEKTVQDLEAANEELKSSNEELLSMNEELQSSNEELETSKEEVQAANDSLSRVNTDLENLLASTRVGTLFLDEAGRIRRVTPEARTIYNLLSGDVGRPLSDITHRAKHMPPLPSSPEVRSQARPFEDEVEMVDGTWYLRRILPYRTSEGVADGVVVTFSDVTELKRAERTVRETMTRLQASEQLYRAIGESIDFGVWVCEPDGRNRYVSDSFLALIGRTQEQCAGFGWAEALHPDDRERTLALWKECVRTGGKWDIEHRVLGVDGRWHPVLARGIPVRSEDGSILCWVGINLDIARQKATETALVTHERELQSIADNTPDLLARFDRSLRRTFVNAAIERVTGRPRSEFLGRTTRESGLSPEVDPLWERAIEQVFATGEGASFEFSLPASDRSIRHYHTRLVPERDPDDTVGHVLAVCHDITATREAEETLRRADRHKDEFLAILAHELRNPLAPIRNGLRLLEALGSDEESARIRRTMDRQLTHLVRLVDDLLDVSRIARGMVHIRREPAALDALIETALEATRPAIEAAGHTLLLRLPDHPVWLDVDPTRISQVLTNLLTNAAKFTPHGGQIAVEAHEEDGAIAISVRDTGVGIAPDLLPRVFDMFGQAGRSVDREHGGLGIGLGLARRLVELHGGELVARSGGPGHGSTFTVRLPPMREPVPDPAPSHGQAPIEPERTPTGLRILVVDDNVDGAETMSRLLELMGHEAAVAHAGPEALAAFAATKPRAVFLDIGLPGMSGYEVARRLRQQQQDPLVLVAVTGWGAERDRLEAQQAGFDYHLVKPVDPRTLEAVLLDIGRRISP